MKSEKTLIRFSIFYHRLPGINRQACVFTQAQVLYHDQVFMTNQGIQFKQDLYTS